MNKAKIQGVGVNLDAFVDRKSLEASDLFSHLSDSDRKAAIDEWAALKGWKSGRKEKPVQEDAQELSPALPTEETENASE